MSLRPSRPTCAPNAAPTLNDEGDAGRVLAVRVQGLAGVLSLVGGVHRGEGEHATSYHGSGTHPVRRPACNKSHVGTFVFPKADAQMSQRVLPVHSTAGVGFPVAVQRNSARWPCWTFSTAGVAAATGWAPSPAVEPNASVKHSARPCDRGGWRGNEG